MRRSTSYSFFYREVMAVHDRLRSMRILGWPMSCTFASMVLVRRLRELEPHHDWRMVVGRITRGDRAGMLHVWCQLEDPATDVDITYGQFKSEMQVLDVLVTSGGNHHPLVKEHLLTVSPKLEAYLDGTLKLDLRPDGSLHIRTGFGQIFEMYEQPRQGSAAGVHVPTHHAVSHGTSNRA